MSGGEGHPARVASAGVLEIGWLNTNLEMEPHPLPTVNLVMSITALDVAEPVVIVFTKEKSKLYPACCVISQTTKSMEFDTREAPPSAVAVNVIEYVPAEVVSKVAYLQLAEVSGGQPGWVIPVISVVTL